MLYAATEAAARPGLAHLGGLLAAIVFAALLIGAHQIVTGRVDHSPPPPDGDDTDMTPGETGDLTPDDTTGDTGWWGRRVRLPDGTLVVRQHAADVLDDEIDVDLEDEETREEMAERLVLGGGSYADWVREIMNAHDVSEATAKRAIRDARDRIDA